MTVAACSSKPSTDHVSSGESWRATRAAKSRIRIGNNGGDR